MRDVRQNRRPTVVMIDRGTNWSSIIARLPADRCLFRGPVGAPEHYPLDLRSWLAEVGPAVLFYHSTPESGGLHIHRRGEIDRITTLHREAYAPHADNLVVFATTPGTGAFHLAMDQEGRIIDLFGSPWDYPTDSRFPVYAGQWRVIAGSLPELVGRMLEAPAEPFYWFSAGGHA